MVTEEDLRRVTLSLPGSAGKPYNRLPSFRVRGNLFIRIHELPDAFFARCAGLEERDELLKAGPAKFFITPHYAGYPAVLVRLSGHPPGGRLPFLVIRDRAARQVPGPGRRSRPVE